MNLHHSIGCVILLAGMPFVSSVASGAETKPIPTLLGQRGKLLVDDDGSVARGRKQKGDLGGQVHVRAGAGRWQRVAEGAVWRSTWQPGMGHTPVVSYVGLRERNLIVEVKFRYGPNSEPWHDQCFRIALDDRPRVTGHIVSAWANVDNDFINTGFLLQHIRKTPDKKLLADLRLDHQPLNVEPKEWYTAVVEAVDDEVLFRMGNHVAYGKSVEIRPEKNLVSLTMGKTWHEVQYVRIWRATPNPSWGSRKKELLEQLSASRRNEPPKSPFAKAE